VKANEDQWSVQVLKFGKISLWPPGVWAALTLSWVAGFVDVVGFIALSDVFVANMTGNTVAIGHGLVTGNWDRVLTRGLAIPVFVAGMFISRLVAQLATHHHQERAMRWLHLAESFALLVFLVLGSYIMKNGVIPQQPTWLYYSMIALPTLAMGIQNAALTTFGPLTVRTTHVTGTLVKFAEQVVNYLVWLQRRTRRVLRITRLRRIYALSRVHPSFREATMLAAVWCAYVFGAVCGASLQLRYQLLSLIAPIVTLCLLASLRMTPTTRTPET